MRWAKEIFTIPKLINEDTFAGNWSSNYFSDMQQDPTPYYGDLLWVFLVLELWHRRHVEVATCCA